ncbi:tRNA-splicing endonuclease subunit Sen34 isoform X1 [Harmonia axyridis]|uniref:tRNA-splicing endonuclease subunit Sen34 isoform X1 n=2 Tax=Harmonia axyridis TaxID=115357 RepID=UPI001E278CCC|nr:tRNA-splicing endonuclease subunit Sen34 isoform X1 [Harmonia axyridis]
MINLILLNSELFIFDVEDWLTLRKEHRIIGDFVGSLNSIPVLPLKLMPEEVTLLLAKEIGKVVNFIQSNDTTENFESNLLEEQRLVYKNNRKRQLEEMFTDIIASKRKKGDTREESEIFNEELNKSSQIPKDKMIWPITLTSLSSVTENVDYVACQKINLQRYSVFKDLWEKGYYITSGEKFGGDFLVYLGDPITHHAIFIVRCVDATTKMTPYDIIAFGRLATSVKKRVVLASLIDDIVSYITVNWIDD